MADYMLYVGTHGGEDPNRAGLLFSAAIAAKGIDKAVVIALLGDAVFLMTDAIAKGAKPMNRASLWDLIQQAKGIDIHC